MVNLHEITRDEIMFYPPNIVYIHVRDRVPTHNRPVTVVLPGGQRARAHRSQVNHVWLLHDRRSVVWPRWWVEDAPG